MNEPNQASDQIEQDFNTIHDALAAKPELLRRILGKTLHQTSQQDIALRLAAAEKQYQAELSKHADELFELYKKLPIDQKIDLLAYAIEIGEINDKARLQASKQMHANRENVISVHKPELASHTTPHANPHRAEDAAESNQKQKPAEVKAPSTLPEAGFVGPIRPVEEKGLINEVGLGNPAAFTVNLPFTHIPGLPCLNQLLEKIDRTTHFDLGFTAKGMADSVANPKGGHDLIYKISYVGFGVMSSKANVQVSPISLKLEDSADRSKWGGSASIFTRQHSDGLGSKVTFNPNDGDASLSYAHEYSYQKPSNKIISTLTAGRFLGNDAAIIRIPAPYVPTIERITKALPSKDEAKIILDRIDKVIPISQAYQIGADVIDKVSTVAKNNLPNAATIKHFLYQQVTESGLSAKSQADVLAKINENFTHNFNQDSLPDLFIKDRVNEHSQADAKQVTP